MLRNTQPVKQWVQRARIMGLVLTFDVIAWPPIRKPISNFAFSASRVTLQPTMRFRGLVFDPALIVGILSSWVSIRCILAAKTVCSHCWLSDFRELSRV